MKKIAIISFFLIPSVICAGNLPTVSHYGLRLQLYPTEGTVRAVVAMKIINTTGREFDTIPFLLYRLFEVANVRGSDGRPLKFEQRIVSFPDDKTFQANAIRIALNRALQPGDSTVVSFDYEGAMLGYSEVMQYVRDRIDTSYALLRPDAIGYPMLAFADGKSWREAYDPRFTYDLRVTVPKEMIVACGGELVDSVSQGDSSEFHYRSKIPTWRMDVAAARFTVLSNPSKKLSVLVLPKDAAGGSVVLRRMESVLQYYTEEFGPLEKYQGYTAIEIPDDWGSQASDFYFLQTSAAFEDTTKMTEVYHELAHMWNAKTTGEIARCRFFDEAFAMYWQNLAAVHFHESVSLDSAMTKLRDWFVQRRLAANPKNGTTPISEYYKEELGGNSYTKGAYALYVLNRVIGDAHFDELMQALKDSRSKGLMDFQKFEQLTERISGKSLKKFFDEWIYRAASTRLMVEKAPIGDIVSRYTR